MSIAREVWLEGGEGEVEAEGKENGGENGDGEEGLWDAWCQGHLGKTEFLGIKKALA